MQVRRMPRVFRVQRLGDKNTKHTSPVGNVWERCGFPTGMRRVQAAERAPASNRALMDTERVQPRRAYPHRSAPANNTGDETSRMPTLAGNGQQQTHPPEPRPPLPSPGPKAKSTLGKRAGTMVGTSAAERLRKTWPSREVAKRAALARTPTTARAATLAAGWCPKYV